jgi:ABC-type uncharacterized transport system involved in gliding motility auxiliary subunit/ABC-type transport system involved in multi-copper enzyme maturation permease subunit
MRAAWTVARRELRALFDHPTGYILLIVFLAITNFLFFRQAYLIRAATLRPMLDFLPWIFLFFVPAVTMRALAEDARTGTLEVVLAQPITERELLLGKYIGQVLFVWVALALTFPVPLGLALGADLQVGIIVAQYIGAAFLAAGLTGIGVWASSTTENQITAFIVGVAVMFLLILVGLNPLIVGLPPMLGTVARNLGVLSHFENITRGVIDLRDVVYFVTLAAIFLALAYLAFTGRRLAPKGATLKRLRLGTALLTAVLVIVNLFGRQIGGRLDLTPGKAYTLSSYTKSLVRNVDDLVTFKLFVSRNLPPEISLVKRDIEDLLSDFRAAGGGKVRVVVRDPDDNEDAEEEARALGIPPVQFNVIGESELSVQEGYLGLAVQYAEGTETIPFIQRTDDLEYRLASYVRSLTRGELPVIGILEQSNEEAGVTYRGVRQSLEENYEVRVLSADDPDSLTSDMAAVVLIGAPPVLSDSQVNRFAAFLQNGGGAFVMAAGMMRQPQGFMAMARPVGWNRVLEPYGVSIRGDMVYDLAANERVQMPAARGFQIIVDYPFWLRALSTRQSAVSQDIESVLLPWASSIDTSGAIPGTVTPLFVTSSAAGTESGRALIAPQREFPRDSLAIQLVAALINPAASDSVSSTPRGRVLVVGTAEFASDRYLQGSPAGLAFVLNAVDWLAQDEGLIAIRSKDRSPPPLVFESDLARDAAKYGNLIGVPVLLIVVAALRLWRRRKRTRQVYRPIGAAGAA